MLLIEYEFLIYIHTCTHTHTHTCSTHVVLSWEVVWIAANRLCGWRNKISVSVKANVLVYLCRLLSRMHPLKALESFLCVDGTRCFEPRQHVLDLWIRAHTRFPSEFVFRIFESCGARICYKHNKKNAKGLKRNWNTRFPRGRVAASKAVCPNLFPPRKTAAGSDCDIWWASKQFFTCIFVYGRRFSSNKNRLS